jgi:methyl-accepting chemotaxis protein WspA
MEQSACYQELKLRWDSRQDDTPIVGEPTVEEGQPVIEYACPIVANGRFYGALKLDRLIADMRTEFEAIAKGGRVDMFVVSPQGRMIVACAGTGRAFSSDPAQWSARPIDELPSGTTLRRIMAAGGGLEALPDPAAGARSLFASAAMGTSGWTVIVGVDERTVLAPIRQETIRTAGLAAVSIAALAVMAYVPARRMARRIRSAVAAAEQVASGDLTRPPSTGIPDDEVGDLLRAIDRMTVDLSSLVGKVHHATSSLRGTAGELTSGADGQRLATSAFRASSEGISAAVQQISSTARQLSSEMERVNAMALDTSVRAQSGRAKLESMESAMVSLDDATDMVAERLATINGRASNIGGVVTTISKVAEHTHLLSVNAAIEAQKAGEYGLGFLVVAREIRRLADQTAQATLDIERIVREMQAAVAGGVSDMQRFGEQVRGNVTEARELSRSMSEIIASVEDSTRSFGAVREGIGRQTAGAESISKAVAVLAGNAGASADAAGEFLGAAEALDRSIGALDTAAAALRVRS